MDISFRGSEIQRFMIDKYIYLKHFQEIQNLFLYFSRIDFLRNIYINHNKIRLEYKNGNNYI